MSAKGLDQAPLPKFLSSIIKRFGHAIGVECQRIPREETLVPDAAIPTARKSQDCASGVKSFDIAVVSENKGGGMAAIRITKPLGGVVIFGKKESGVCVLGGAFIKKAIDGLQKARGLV